jgi:hypothetical protein
VAQLAGLGHVPGVRLRRRLQPGIDCHGLQARERTVMVHTVEHRTAFQVQGGLGASRPGTETTQQPNQSD